MLLGYNLGSGSHAGCHAGDLGAVHGGLNLAPLCSMFAIVGIPGQ